MSTAADRAAWQRNAYRMGYTRPDDQNPFRKGTPSSAAWKRGREDRLLSAPPRDIDTELAQRQLENQP